MPIRSLDTAILHTMAGGNTCFPRIIIIIGHYSHACNLVLSNLILRNEWIRDSGLWEFGGLLLIVCETGVREGCCIYIL